MTDPHPSLTLEQAITMRDACLVLPDTCAFTATSMLYVLENYIRVVRELERSKDLWDGTYDWPQA